MDGMIDLLDMLVALVQVIRQDIECRNVAGESPRTPSYECIQAGAEIGRVLTLVLRLSG
jgi:hypothetical protein